MRKNSRLWNREYKIPWNDPAFSARMLREHLSREHDLASRRTEWIDRQVQWIHDELLGAKPGRILDIGCGPGFYAHRLTAPGHGCFGIDFAPTSIAYAEANNPALDRCQFVLDDVRTAEFGGPFDLALILYGEINVFAPDEAAALLRKTSASLAPGGWLLVEAHTLEAVEAMGRAEPTVHELDAVGCHRPCPESVNPFTPQPAGTARGGSSDPQ